jgi:hypothetical protein
MDSLLSPSPEISSLREKTPAKQIPLSTECAVSPSPEITSPRDKTPTEQLLPSTKSAVIAKVSTEVTAVAKTPENKKTPKAFRRGQSKHTPVKPKGAIAIHNGTVDRSPAHVNDEDRSKLNLRWSTIVPDKSHPGQYVAGPDILYTYPRSVDWTSKDSIRALNAWREQLFRRNFGEARKTREKYGKSFCLTV